QIHSMQSLQAHAPQMKEIQRKYKGDRQKQNEELMKFYRENNINPMSSCLPLLAQFPIFIALFYVLREFAKNPPGGDLSWFGVVPSIAVKATDHWSGYMLLAVYALSQVSSTYFMSATMDKTQRTLMMVLPVAFLPVVSHFPTGLVLYWMTTNLWTVGQGLVTRRLAPKKGDAPTPVDTAKRTSRTPPKATDGAQSAPPRPVQQQQPSAPKVVRRKKQKRARR